DGVGKRSEIIVCGIVCGTRVAIGTRIVGVPTRGIRICGKKMRAVLRGACGVLRAPRAVIRARGAFAPRLLRRRSGTAPEQAAKKVSQPVEPLLDEVLAAVL